MGGNTDFRVKKMGDKSIGSSPLMDVKDNVGIELFLIEKFETQIDAMLIVIDNLLSHLIFQTH